MPATLRRMLKSYEFFNQAIVEHQRRLAPAALDDMGRRRDECFLDILMHEAKDPRVTLAQLRFIHANLASLARQPRTLRAALSACERHLDLIAARLQPKAALLACRSPLGPSPSANRALTTPAYEDFLHFDALSDRVAVLDTEFRYVFTNAANAAFHGVAARSFVGRLNSDVVGEHYFASVSLPRMRQCLAGQVVDFITSHPLRDASRLYSVTIDPVRDQTGQCVAMVIVSRDVSRLRLPADLNVYRPSV